MGKALKGLRPFCFMFSQSTHSFFETYTRAVEERLLGGGGGGGGGDRAMLQIFQNG